MPPGLNLDTVGATAFVRQTGGKNLRLRNGPGLDTTAVDGLVQVVGAHEQVGGVDLPRRASRQPLPDDRPVQLGADLRDRLLVDLAAQLDEPVPRPRLGAGLQSCAARLRLGPPLLGYGKARNFAASEVKSVYDKIYNSQSVVACSNLCEFTR